MLGVADGGLEQVDRKLRVVTPDAIHLAHGIAQLGQAVLQLAHRLALAAVVQARVLGRSRRSCGRAGRSRRADSRRRTRGCGRHSGRGGGRSRRNVRIAAVCHNFNRRQTRADFHVPAKGLRGRVAEQLAADGGCLLRQLRRRRIIGGRQRDAVVNRDAVVRCDDGDVLAVRRHAQHRRGNAQNRQRPRSRDVLRAHHQGSGVRRVLFEVQQFIRRGRGLLVRQIAEGKHARIHNRGAIAQHTVRQRITRLRRQRIHLLVGRSFRDNQRLRAVQRNAEQLAILRAAVDNRVRNRKNIRNRITQDAHRTGRILQIQLIAAAKIRRVAQMRYRRLSKRGRQHQQAYQPCQKLLHPFFLLLRGANQLWAVSLPLQE